MALEGLVEIAAQWVQDAVKRVGKRDAAKVANLVSDSGILLACIRELDLEFQSLYRPLLYFDFKIDDDEREELCERLIAFAAGSRIGPIVNGARGRLSKRAKVRDFELDAAIERLVLLSGQALQIPSLTGYLPPTIDFALAGGLDELLDRIRNSRDPTSAAELGDVLSDIWVLQNWGDPDHQFLPAFSDGSRETWNQYRESGSARRQLSPLAFAANVAEGIYGEIIAGARRLFPELPTPTFAWGTQVGAPLPAPSDPSRSLSDS